MHSAIAGVQPCTSSTDWPFRAAATAPTFLVLLHKIRLSATMVPTRASFLRDAAQKTPIDAAMVAFMSELAMKEREELKKYSEAAELQQR